MSTTIQTTYGARPYSVPTKAKQSEARAVSFLDLAAKTARTSADTLEIAAAPEIPSVDAYLEHLKSKYGRVTVESIGKDQASLEKAGKRMSGHDVIIAPNILEEMANDPKTALYYEKKIDDFFSATPRLKAHFAAQGLTYEPCGVVIHEDGSVTYICGGGDTPERVAEVNRINRERDAKRTAQRKRYFEQSAAAALERQAMLERSAKRFSHIGGLLKTRIETEAEPPEIFLPAGVDLFFLGQ